MDMVFSIYASEKTVFVKRKGARKLIERGRGKGVGWKKCFSKRGAFDN